MSKRFRMFAGPNGSGKSSLIAQIKKDFNMGYFINADIVEAELKNQRFLDCDNYISKTLSQADWDTFVRSYDMLSRVGNDDFPRITITDNVLVAEETVNSYHASVICEFFRKELLSLSDSFSFETVMSHHSKVEFLHEAKTKGFKTYLYFICTQDPEINISRVRNRHIKGGHDVPREKIVDRYYRSLELLASAFKLVDRAFVLDNSNKSRDVIVEKDGKHIFIHNSAVPAWIEKYLFQRLNLE